MKNAITTVLLVLMVLLINSCIHKDKTALDQNSGDSIYLSTYINKVSARNPEAALHLCDDAERKGMMCHADAVREKASIFLRYYNDIDSAAVLIRSIVKDDSVLASPKRRLKVFELISTIALQRNNYVVATHYSKQGLRLAQELRDSSRYGFFMFNVGQALWCTGARDVGMREMMHSIALLERIDPSIEAKLLLSKSIGKAAFFLIEERKLEDAWQLSKKHESLIDSLAQVSDVNLDRARGYCYADMAHINVLLGNKAEAESYVKKFWGTKMAQTAVGKMAIIPYLFYSGKYGQLLSYHQDIMAYKGSDTISDDFIKLLRLESIALEHQGNLKAAIVKLHTISNLKDSLRAFEYLQTTAHMQEQFNTEQLRAEVQEKINQRNILNIIVAVVLVLIAILIGIFIAYVRHSKAMLAKNRKLIEEHEAFNRQVDDQNVRYKEEVERENREMASIQMGARASEKLQKQTDSLSDKVPEGYDMHSLKAIRLKLLQYLDEEKLYKDPTLTRAMVLRKLVIKDAELSAVLKYTMNGDSLIKVINGIRIKKCCLELKEHPEYTIEAISQDCGFSSLRTFQRTFKDFMGMTSTEYRKAVASQV